MKKQDKAHASARDADHPARKAKTRDSGQGVDQTSQRNEGMTKDRGRDTAETRDRTRGH